MLVSMTPKLQKNLEHFVAYDMLQELKTMFSQQVEHELLQTVRASHTCKQEKGQSESSYNYNMHDLGKTMNELHAMLKLHEQSLPKKDVTPAGKYRGKGKSKLPCAPKPKIPPPLKKDNPAKDAICHQCGEVGYWIRNCLVYLAETMMKKKQASSASTLDIFIIELYSFPNWVYDIGCGTHIYNTTQGLRGSKKPKSGALNLYVGNGHRAVVKAIGSFNLRLPNGLVIVLDNCHYAPSIARGIILVSHLNDNGFVNCFENGGISVSKDNLLYFYAILRDGIYNIDLHYSNLNESSIYAISNKRSKLYLDSTLLWHCHLRYMNKKRIEKLQHDRLLKPIDGESFDKCVSCMSSKIARKPFPHQMERAKDLLRLIHTDVCGPFRTVSR
ncbi:zinc finger, CCHC-type containing protein [Tanacetum coccineum]